MENPVEQNGEQNVEKIGTSSSSSYVCRQSSTRWTPTTEQIKMLKELYYINGVRSPTADQIQAICSRLRRYGKIEGKNVFYWFQNHKARERQKKRLTPTSININNNINCWKQDDFTKYPTSSTSINNNNFTTTTTNNNNNNNNINNINNNNNNPGISCSSSSASMISAAAGGGGQLMGSFGYGAMTMENKFRDCSISGGFNTTPQWTSPAAAAATGGTTNYNTTSYASFPNFHDKLSATFDEDHEQDHYVVTTEIETLPLFPMHDKDNDHNNNNNNNNNQFSRDHQFPSSAGFYTGGYCWSNGGGNGASLELTLNSYGYGCYSHNY